MGLPPGSGAVPQPSGVGAVSACHQGFPDIHFRIEEIVAGEDVATIRFAITGTHQGGFRGPPDRSCGRHPGHRETPDRRWPGHGVTHLPRHGGPRGPTRTLVPRGARTATETRLAETPVEYPMVAAKRSRMYSCVQLSCILWLFNCNSLSTIPSNRRHQERGPATSDGHVLERRRSRVCTEHRL